MKKRDAVLNKKNLYSFDRASLLTKLSSKFSKYGPKEISESSSPSESSERPPPPPVFEPKVISTGGGGSTSQSARELVQPNPFPLKPVVNLSAEFMHTFYKVIKHFPQNKATKERLKIENQKCPRIENFIEMTPYELAKLQFNRDGQKPVYPLQYVKK